ncbi:MAG TPA: DUF362 domain-containing protein [Candidatus Atribacteria bacterium]|nr:DUF362 domain-containing protein [Candidatus Atribacteria bacterium]HPT78267.1 DUF362 domain-containing protein [Candidatus Atribacteria bacterium]
MSKVAIVKCADYDPDSVYASVSKSLELLGGLDKYIKPGMRVLLKCNLLMKKRPEEAATTHPEVAAALARAVREAGAHPIIADSPGGLYTTSALKGVYKACGMEEVSNRDGIELNYNVETLEVNHPEGRLVKHLTVIRLLEEVDAVISVCKLKTHSLALFTGAVKNLFGVIPGTAKAEYHLRMKRIEDFSDMLVDISTYVKPVLSVMDAVVGMEGEGPSAGTPRKIGAILASPSPYALDVVAASMVGIDTGRVWTIQKAKERGLCSDKLADVVLLGDSFDDLYIKDFRIPRHKEKNPIERYVSGNSRIARLVRSRFGPRPVFIHHACIGCRDCQRNCPPRAIEMVDNKPYVDLDKCIRCYCCQELCPKKAIVIKQNWLFRVFR